MPHSRLVLAGVLTAVLTLAAGFTTPAAAQSGPGMSRLPAGAQPRVIVIPFVKEGQDIRTILDADFDRRLAVSKVKEAFDRRGFSTVDFMGAVRQASLSSAAAAESESDFRTRLFEMNRADVYVVTDYKLSSVSGLASAMMILSAHLTANGMSLGDKSASSPKIREPIEAARLVGVAVEIGVDSLLDVMGRKMAEFQEEGVPVMLELRVGQGSAVNLETVSTGASESLADLIEAWVAKNAHKGVYSPPNVTRNMMTFPDVRLPLRDAQGRPPSPNRFAQELMRYLREVGVRNPERVISTGAIYVDLK